MSGKRMASILLAALFISACAMAAESGILFLISYFPFFTLWLPSFM